jgi:ribosomal protein S1
LVKVRAHDVALNFSTISSYTFTFDNVAPVALIQQPVGVPTTAYKEGDAVTASILKINKKDRKIDLSIRRFEKNEERELLKKYSGKNDRMTIGDVTGWND